MSKNTGPDSVPNTTITEASVFAYLLDHYDEKKKDIGKAFKYVGSNYELVKPYITASILSEIRQWVADGLGATYEEVALFLDEDNVTDLLGVGWDNV